VTLKGVLAMLPMLKLPDMPVMRLGCAGSFDCDCARFASAIFAPG
jgi:hypothetical protein